VGVTARATPPRPHPHDHGRPPTEDGRRSGPGHW
jgi:hypothetical protein